MPYTYLGRLSYITHDAQRERPVYFQWQVIDEWPPSDGVLRRMGLLLSPGTQHSAPARTPSGTVAPALVEGPPPTASPRVGTHTPDFRARKAPDRSIQDAKNRQLGLAGERSVVDYERERLRAAGRRDLADRVRHVSVIEGDGAGYDVMSFEHDGSGRFIEVKTTAGGAGTDFLISASEVEFSKRHSAQYWLYRVYDFDIALLRGRFYVRRGSLADDSGIELAPITFRARITTPRST